MRVLYPGGIGIWRCWFILREENRRTRRKTRNNARTKKKLNPHMAPGRDRTWATLYWWEASALTTPPSLLSPERGRGGKKHEEECMTVNE